MLWTVERIVETSELEETLETKSAVTKKPDSVLVDYKGVPSIRKMGNYEVDFRTIAYRDPKDPPQYDYLPDGGKILKPGQVYELDLYPGINEIPERIWLLIKDSISELLKPGRRLIVVPVEDIGEIKTGNEDFVTEKWVKERPLMVYCGKFSELTTDKVATLIDRCVNEELLEKLLKAFPDEAVQVAVEVQKQRLEDVIIKHWYALRSSCYSSGCGSSR